MVHTAAAAPVSDNTMVLIDHVYCVEQPIRGSLSPAAHTESEVANLIDLDATTPQAQQPPHNPFAPNSDNLHVQLANMSK